MTDRIHERFLREAIELSRRNVREGKGGPFGAVVVRKGTIISRGTNLVTATNDPTAHAEVVAIRAACRVLKSFHLQECTIYSSCEPCPMCLGAIYWARLEGLVFANTRDDAAAIGFDDRFLYDELPAPFSARKIPTRQMLRDEALVAFREWTANENKIPY